MIVTSVQIKTVKTQKHLYCPVFTKTVLSKLLETVFICGKLGEMKPETRFVKVCFCKAVCNLH